MSVVLLHALSVLYPLCIMCRILDIVGHQHLTDDPDQAHLSVQGYIMQDPNE